jgi:C-terminal processing protease CtpA/Prc
MKSILCLLGLLLPAFLFSQTESEKMFTRQEIQEDLAFFIKTIENVHPNPYHSVSKENFKSLSDSLDGILKDNVSLSEAWTFFSRLIAAYDEGHSTVAYPSAIQQQIKEGKVRIFPVLVREFNGEGLLVRYDLSKDSVLKTGDLITHINGRSAGDLMQYLTSFYGGLPSWRTTQTLRDFGGQLLLHQVVPPYRIRYKSGGENKEVVIQAVTLGELQARAVEVRKRISVSTISTAPYSFERTAENIGYINFRSMQDLPVFEKFLDSIFTNIKNKPVKGLIIDLRQNGGGSSVLGEKLISYISSKPYRMGGGSRWKVSDEYKTFIQERAKTNPVYASGSFQHYLERKTGDIISGTAGKPQSPGKNGLRYKGKVAVLTGPNTFSSANMLSNAIKDYGLATIIGEATGEPCNDYGELYWTKLPRTGLLFYTCSKQFIRANGDANDPNPVLPDIEVKQDPNSLKDDVLKYAKEWLMK